MNATLAAYTPSPHHEPVAREGVGAPPGEGAAAAAPSARARRAGQIVSGLASAFLLFDAVMKVARVPQAVEAMPQLGYPVEVVLPLGLIQLACLAAYLVPRTAVLGALLWTGYLGGAIATHVRVGNPLFSHVLFPIYVATLLWGGLWLREPRLRALLPHKVG